MRICKVRFKNLNSLVGEWELDLTHSAYESDGIFAITGPTGAGKTTLLDAICLALYGRTPRLSRVSSSSNDIMSRQTGECSAEVTFETLNGRFRCHWSQHRAYRQPDGELQNPRHEISDPQTRKILELGIRDVSKCVETVTGMDFDRFTRSMLLAQGGFSAFLQAAPDERAPILEQITGTEVYSQISTRVHEILRDEERKVELLKAEVAGIRILDEERVSELRQKFDSLTEEEEVLAENLRRHKVAIDWLGQIQSLKEEIDNLTEEQGTLGMEMDAFEPDRNKLDNAMKANSLERLYATLTSIRRQQEEDRESLEKTLLEIPQLRSAARKQSETLEKAEQQTRNARKNRQEAAHTLKMVRALDLKLDERVNAINENEKSCSKVAADIEKNKQSRSEQLQIRSKTEKSLQHVFEYLQEHAIDESLTRDLTGLEERLNWLVSLKTNIAQKESTRDTAASGVENAKQLSDGCREKTRTARQDRKLASEKLENGKAVLDKLLKGRQLREYRAEKVALLRESALIAIITKLEDHREKLEDGKPCPLCGATEHPYASGNVPFPDEVERKIEELTGIITSAEKQDDILKDLERAEIASREALREAERNESNSAGKLQTAESILVEAENDLESHLNDFKERKLSMDAELHLLGIQDIPESDLLSPLETLRNRCRIWQEHVDERERLENVIDEINNEVNRLDSVIETQKGNLTEVLRRQESLKSELQAAQNERFALFGDRNPDEVEENLNREVTDAEDSERVARSLHTERQQELKSANTKIVSLEERIGQREPEHRELEREFSTSLESLGFAGEEQFLEARLPEAKRDELSHEARRLDDRATELRTKLEDRKSRLSTEKERRITGGSLHEHELNYAEAKESMNQVRNELATIRHELQENEKAKEQVREKMSRIKDQQIEYQRWKNLHALVGSADGKKFRNFAQGLTFEVMIGHANRQLGKMSDRYLLIRNESQPLELNVIDNYQASEIRTTKNLSGGESFIVSLSLALGLSSMTSRNVSVDSLFLDEGFGTLDEEALEIALETLVSLHQDGKLIGVISHVPALKERIGTQIRITPQARGRSRISGPGCRELQSR